MIRAFNNFLNGQWVSSHTNKTFSVHNPAHKSEVVALCQASDGADVTRAVDAAANAFEAWSRTSPIKRGSFLNKAAQILAARRDEAATLLTREEGKILAESRGEVDRAIGLLEFYAAQGPILSGETFPSSVEGRMLFTTRVAIGPVALITPWNFPLAIPVWKTAPALLCGNTIVLKPAERAPASACLFAEILHEAGLPPGVFNLVNGTGLAAGQPLTADPRIRCISFTGSVAVGKSIAKSCAERLIRVGLELGGKNPHIIAGDADLERAVNDVMVGAFWGAGHKCTACSRAIVLESAHDAFLDMLAKCTADLRIGDGLDSNTQIPPLIDEIQLNKVLEYISIGQQEGARLVMGGKRLTGGQYDDGNYLSPAIFADVTPKMRIAQEEIFGPVLAVMKAKNLDEAIHLANQVEFGLSASIATRSIATSLDFARRIEAGVVHINSPTAGLELQLPFGGCKCSTSGYREMGKAAIDFYSMTKTVYMDG